MAERHAISIAEHEVGYSHLLSPFAIGPVQLRNRVVFQPHFTALGTLDGMPSDEHVAYHEERARGGVGLIILESMAIHPTGKMSRRFVNAWDPAVVPGLARIADAVHAHGAKLFGQLTHGGHTSLEHPPHIMWAPTQMPEPSSHHSTKAMDEDDIRAAIEGFAASARNLVDAGLDGIEIKIAHDGLLRSFASPFFNRRTDAYGGSFENRMRLSYEVIAAIKAATGPHVPLGVRICVNEFTPFGYDTDYGLEMVRSLEATGMIDYFNSDAGSFSSYWMEIPPAAVAADDFRRINTALKHATGVPVIGFGRISPQSGEALIAAGDADLVGMARQLIADPETVNKIAAGRGDLVRLCIACNDGCIYQVGQEKAVRCVHNPGAGQERRMSERLVRKAETSRHVVIAGGGPAGLKVAEIAARRGHRVSLLEKARRLGGQVNLASLQPEHASIGEVTSYLEAAVADLGVEVHLGAPATPESILALSPDVVVVATGSEPNLPIGPDDASEASRALGRQILPEIEGLDRDCVVSSDQVLSGEKRLSGHVVVIDDNGHWEAAGTAEYLADENCRVTVIAGHGMIGEDIEAGTRTLFHRRAAIKGIRLMPNTSLVAIEERRVRISPVFSDADAIGWAKYILMPGDDSFIDDVDWVVPVIGRRSREDLYLELKTRPEFKGIEIARVGDCVAPRLIQSTILEAFEFARGL
ncbi:FAD-dependent oxidoreductase [Rhizobium sp. BK251]|uniref:oxidoreductase n=1 Tax=Rhizobium sp. BK251 TaxID=2512125 RepID=UPI0010533721|nr:FAD-dependent oxidoreductase [Rhizobium sp. BK251]TCL68374.1 2,4-dienoyl-CoA reductase-like NADH-dependent reductase (Old Yellow Enzyme family) [Rhizobium sp. BK251]